MFTHSLNTDDGLRAAEVGCLFILFLVSRQCRRRSKHGGVGPTTYVVHFRCCMYFDVLCSVGLIVVDPMAQVTTSTLSVGLGFFA